jgi:hypothetical protein
MSGDEMKSVKPTDGPFDYDHTLYVIFHGAIAFYDDPSLPWIDAFVTNLKDEHVYVCGKFLGELRIPAGSIMALSGVTPGQDSFGNYSSKYIHYTGPGGLGGARVHLDNVYSQLTFPRPDLVLHTFNFSRSDGQNPRELCIVPVFQYRFVNVHDLRLRMFLNYGLSCAADGVTGKTSTTISEDTGDEPAQSDCFNWKPSALDPTPLTLHVRAEEDGDKSQADDLVAQILGDYTKLELPKYDTYDRGDDLPGFTDDRRFWEIDLSLSKRATWLTQVGGVIQRHPPAPGTSFVVVAPVTVKDDDPSCRHESGGPG